MKRKSNVWLIIFGRTLKIIFTQYNMNNHEFSKNYECDISNIKNWKNSRSFPSNYLFNALMDYIEKKAATYLGDEDYIYKEIYKTFESFGYQTVYLDIKQEKHRHVDFVKAVLTYCRDAGKGNILVEVKIGNQYQAENRTKVVVFDFDGTLTVTGKIAKTIWEQIWIDLGYDIKECQALHKKFDRNEISHNQWCLFTEQKFKEKGCHKNLLKEIAEKVELIDGVEETFEALKEKDIKIYIVSGSILSVIQTVLGNLNQYVDEIKANNFLFNREGYLSHIVGTKYDFEGKAKYILQISNELEISPKDILFVGNSKNDRLVYTSGARTLCINPRLTDVTNTKVWNENIETCANLLEILDFIV